MGTRRVGHLLCAEPYAEPFYICHLTYSCNVDICVLSFFVCVCVSLVLMRQKGWLKLMSNLPTVSQAGKWQSQNPNMNLSNSRTYILLQT